ncbi:hypothetical protein N182_28820 [Sinorhizobium sp. GL2]|nr:hypothetical protein N182_28820 [Sinorhizobium sp. GL2]
MTSAAIERGIQRLRKRLQMVEEFDPNTLDARDPRSTTRPLEAEIEAALTETFGQGTIEYNRYAAAAHFNWPLVLGRGIAHQEKVDWVAKDRLQSIQLLTAAIALLQERLSESEEKQEELPSRVIASASKRIFIVHGRDNEPKEAVARFLTSLGYAPVILHEMANRGRTIIQKFREEASDVGFAVVLMTPDDEMPNGEMRARQNVILELGFFLGKLGPERVAAIVKGKLETPSDFDGVVYTPYDAGWKSALAKELDAAGYEFDWNTVMRER